MAKIPVANSLYSKFESLAEELDGFSDADELVTYILSESATELNTRSSKGPKESVNEDAVQDRLKQLGYVE